MRIRDLERQLAETRRISISDKEQLRNALNLLTDQQSKHNELLVRIELERRQLENARIYRLIRLYYRIYSVPILGPILSLMRTLVGKIARMTLT